MSGKVLLLGMVYSTEKDPKTGQMFRDRVRCEAMENLGYDVKTLDDKHDGNDAQFVRLGKHCDTNFANHRRMFRAMQQSWGTDVAFDLIILDYFFCPAGYVNMRWAEKFFKETLPTLAVKNILDCNGIKMTENCKKIYFILTYNDEMLMN